MLFKVVQNVYVSWIFFGGLCRSQNNILGGYPVGVVVGAKKFVTLDPKNRQLLAMNDNT